MVDVAARRDSSINEAPQGKNNQQGNSSGQPIEVRQKEKEQQVLGKTDDNQSFEKRLEEMFDKPKDILLTMKTIFPFDLFPDEITINPLMIRITSKEFFGSEEVKTLLIKDIEDVTAEVSPFLSTLKIIDKKDKTHPLLIQPLKKEDAQKAEKIIAGLVIGQTEGDIRKVEPVG